MGYRIIARIRMADPKQLKLGKPYQRSFEMKRKMGIIKSIQKWGWWVGEQITITPDYGVVDGQHRVLAAIELGIALVPVTIMEFDSIEEEAAYFMAKDSFDTKLNIVQQWHARFIAKDPLAKILYRLDVDPDSRFHNRIALKGRATFDTRFVISSTWDIVSISLGLISNHFFEFGRGTPLPPIAQKILETDYLTIRTKCNVFLDWFYACFSESKPANPIPYKSLSIRALGAFYLQLDRQGLNPRSTVNVNRMKNFIFTSEFVRASVEDKLLFLKNYYNKGKRVKILH